MLRPRDRQVGFYDADYVCEQLIDSVGKPYFEFNLYTYTGNNPINWVDPLGLYLTTSQQIKASLASSVGAAAGFLVGSVFGAPTAGSALGGMIAGAVATATMEGSTWQDVVNNAIYGGISGLTGAGLGSLFEGTLMSGMQAAVLTGVMSGSVDIILMGGEPLLKAPPKPTLNPCK